MDQDAGSPDRTLIEATFTTDPKLVMRSYRACHFRAVGLRYAASGVLVLTGIVAGSVPFIVVGVLLPVVAEFSVRRQLRPYLQGERQVTISMTENEYRTRGEDRATSRTWTTMEQVRRRGAFWVLQISSAAAMAIPVDALDEAQTAAFVDLLKRKGLLRQRS